MNSKKVQEAAARAFEKLSNLTDEEFGHELALHADGDVAKALLDLHCFEVGQAESDAFQFEMNEIPNSQLAWHEITQFNAADLESSPAFAVNQWLRETPDLIHSWKDAAYCFSDKCLGTTSSDIYFGEANFEFIGQFADWIDANVGGDSYVIAHSLHDENQEQEPWRLAA